MMTSFCCEKLLTMFVRRSCSSVTIALPLRDSNSRSTVRLPKGSHKRDPARVSTLTFGTPILRDHSHSKQTLIEVRRFVPTQYRCTGHQSSNSTSGRSRTPLLPD